MVPGESFLGVLDALHLDPRIEPVTARNEAGAAMMAQATGALTGRPGVAIVTRGPGAVNALAGVYVAAQNHSPLVLLVGLPPRAKSHWQAFQAIDLERTFSGIAKHAAIAESPQSLAPRLSHAFAVAGSGRPGPVVLGLPEDVLLEASGAPSDLFAPSTTDIAIAPPPSARQLAELYVLLSRASRPLLIAGASLWSTAAAHDLATFAERYDLPVAAAFRRQDRMDNSHRCYAGHLGFVPDSRLAAAAREADLVIVLGSCLDDVTTHGFTLFKDRGQGRQLVLIAADPRAFASPYAPSLAIAACPIRTAKSLPLLPVFEQRPPWSKWRRALRSAYEASLVSPRTAAAVDLAEIIAHLSGALPHDAIVCNGAGQYAATLQRYFVYRGYPSQLAPISGSMGYGLPAAIAAKLANPKAPVVCIAGDGCLQMTIQELATLAQLDLPFIVIVANNAALGSIREAQIARARQSPIATALINPDFCALARAYGLTTFKVGQTREFPACLAAAMAATGPCLIELDLTA